MEITVNGEIRTVPVGISVAQLLNDLKIRPDRVAVEVNLDVVRHDAREGCFLSPGDRVEIVSFVGGGQ